MHKLSYSSELFIRLNVKKEVGEKEKSDVSGHDHKKTFILSSVFIWSWILKGRQLFSLQKPGWKCVALTRQTRPQVGILVLKMQSSLKFAFFCFLKTFFHYIPVYFFPITVCLPYVYFVKCSNGKELEGVAFGSQWEGSMCFIMSLYISPYYLSTDLLLWWTFQFGI